jgi:hypothetical protein
MFFFDCCLLFRILDHIRLDKKLAEQTLDINLVSSYYVWDVEAQESPTCCPTTKQKLANLSRLGKWGPDGSRVMQQNGPPCSPRGVERKHAANPKDQAAWKPSKTKSVTAGGTSEEGVFSKTGISVSGAMTGAQTGLNGNSASQ